MVDTIPITSLTQVDDVTVELDADNKVRLKDRGISLAKMATGTAGQYLGYDGSGNPAEVSPAKTELTKLSVNETLHAKYNSNLNDSSIKQRTISAASPSYPAGKIGNAITENTATRPNTNVQSYDNLGTTHSAAFWFKKGTIGTCTLLSSETADDGNNYRIRINSNKLQLKVGASTFDGTTTLSNATWYHVVVVKNGTSWTVYLNGASEITATATLTLDTGNTWGLGYHPASGSAEDANADFDDWRLYGTNLSAAQVATVYNSGNGTEDGVNSTGYYGFTFGNNNALYLWADFNNKVRIHTSKPTDHADGTIVGTQS